MGAAGRREGGGRGSPRREKYRLGGEGPSGREAAESGGLRDGAGERGPSERRAIRRKRGRRGRGAPGWGPWGLGNGFGRGKSPPPRRGSRRLGDAGGPLGGDFQRGGGIFGPKRRGHGSGIFAQKRRRHGSGIFAPKRRRHGGARFRGLPAKGGGSRPAGEGTGSRTALEGPSARREAGTGETAARRTAEAAETAAGGRRAGEADPASLRKSGGDAGGVSIPARRDGAGTARLGGGGLDGAPGRETRLSRPLPWGEGWESPALRAEDGARALSKAVQRDARRYDGGFTIY